jgi:hypothetical protein
MSAFASAPGLDDIRDTAGHDTEVDVAVHLQDGTVRLSILWTQKILLNATTPTRWPRHFSAQQNTHARSQLSKDRTGQPAPLILLGYNLLYGFEGDNRPSKMLIVAQGLLVHHYSRTPQ